MGQRSGVWFQAEEIFLIRGLVAIPSTIASTWLIINLHYLFENCAFIYRFSFKNGKDISHQRRQNRLRQVRLDMAVLVELLLTYSNATINSHLKRNRITDIFLFSSTPLQLIIQGKMGYMLWLEQAIIRFVTRTLHTHTHRCRHTCGDTHRWMDRWRGRHR